MRHRNATEWSVLAGLTADVAGRVRAFSAAYRALPRRELEALTLPMLEALLEAAAGAPDALEALVEERIQLRARQGFPPGDLLALVDAVEAALADALEEPAGRSALGDPPWPGVLAALDRARVALLARLGLFDADEEDARVRRAADARRVAVLLSQLLTARADERARLGREFHDGPLQSLTVAVLRLDAVRTRLVDSAPEEAREAGQILTVLRESLETARALLFSPVPAAGDGLAATLRGLLDRFAGETGVDAELDDGLDERPPSDVELQALEVVEEALANVAVHARAGRVVVRLARSGPLLEVIVADDGLGFRVDEIPWRGLELARHRAELGGGALAVESEPGAGATVRLSLPAWV